MHEFFKNIGPEVWITLTVLINQGLSALRTWLSRKQISKSVQQIKDQVTPNGGGSMNDGLVKANEKIDKLIINQQGTQDMLQAYFTVMMNNDDKAQARADKEGNWVFCNARLTEVFGMYHRDMFKKGWQVAVGNNVKERNEFITAWTEYFKDGSPLNHTVNILNQDTHLATAYLVTAHDVVVDDKFQFHLVKFQRA